MNLSSDFSPLCGVAHRGPEDQECKETSCVSHVEKLDLRFLQNEKETFLVSVTHLVLRFAIVQNKF